MRLLLSFLLTFATTTPALAELNVFACEPAWGALSQVIGGDDVHVVTAATAAQDPHHIQARPSLIARLRRADLLVCSGSELEIGWLPLLLRQANNPAVAVGTPGYLAASDLVTMLDIPTRVDRAEGDVHPFGNPHIQTDPRNILPVADVLAKRLAQLDPAHAAGYQQRHDAFVGRFQAAIRGWEREAAPLRGVAVIAHHHGWSYLEQWLGLEEVGTLEERPGIPPSTAHLAALLHQLKARPAQMVIRSPFQDSRASEWLAHRVKIRQVVLPFTVGGTPEAKDLFSFYDDTVHRLLAALPVPAARQRGGAGAGVAAGEEEEVGR